MKFCIQRKERTREREIKFIGHFGDRIQRKDIVYTIKLVVLLWCVSLGLYHQFLVDSSGIFTHISFRIVAFNSLHHISSDNQVSYPADLSISVIWNNHNLERHFPDNKVHGANMGPTWVRQDPGGSHVGPKNLAIRVTSVSHTLQESSGTTDNIAK